MHWDSCPWKHLHRTHLSRRAAGCIIVFTILIQLYIADNWNLTIELFEACPRFPLDVKTKHKLQHVDLSRNNVYVDFSVLACLWSATFNLVTIDLSRNHISGAREITCLASCALSMQASQLLRPLLYHSCFQSTSHSTNCEEPTRWMLMLGDV